MGTQGVTGLLIELATAYDPEFSRNLAGLQAALAILATERQRAPTCRISTGRKRLLQEDEGVDGADHQPGPGTATGPDAYRRLSGVAKARRREGAPLVGGVYLRDVKTVEVGPWPRKGDGVRGALCYLDGDDETDEHIVGLPPGDLTAPLRHLYSEAIYVLFGRGSPPSGGRVKRSRPRNGAPAAPSSCPPTPGISSSMAAWRVRPGGSP